MTQDPREFEDAGSHSITGERLVERNARRVLRLLAPVPVARTQDAIQIGPNGGTSVIVLVTAEAFEFRLPTVEWTGPHWPAESTRLWRRVKAEGLTDEALAELLLRAWKARQAEFKRCRHCGRFVPVERRFGSACHGCAERHLGVVF